MPGSGARRAWGWHPLLDDWAGRVVADARVRPGELVLDLGAGDGALTRHLLLAGARVVAVELHPGRADRLRDRFAGSDVQVRQVDVAALVLPRRPFRVVGSPPYALTSDLLRRLLGRGSRLVAADLVLQRASARRLVADGGPRGARVRGGRCGGRWALALGRPVPRRAFRPPPRVDAQVLVVRRR